MKRTTKAAAAIGMVLVALLAGSVGGYRAPREAAVVGQTQEIK